MGNYSLYQIALYGSFPQILLYVNIIQLQLLLLYNHSQIFPGDLLPSTYPNPENPERIIGRSEVERRSDYIQLLHGQLGEQHPLVQLVHQCLQNAPARRPSAEELLQQLEAVRAQIEGPYGSQLVKVDVVKVGMVKALKEKDTEIGRLQQQLEVYTQRHTTLLSM